MKKSIILGILISAAFSAFAESAYDIAKKSDDLDCSKTSASLATMTITNKKGTTRVRQVMMKEKDYGSVKKSVVVFESPKDVEGVAYLSWEYEKDSAGNKKDDDNWLYMPAMKKTRRISGSESDGDFMGTDFTYKDMGDSDLDDYTYELSGEETVEGELCYKLKVTAKDATVKEPVRTMWICKADYMMARCEFFDRQNALHRVLVCGGKEKIDGYLTCRTMTMTNVQTNHSTVLERSDISFDKAIDDNIFTVAALENDLVR